MRRNTILTLLCILFPVVNGLAQTDDNPNSAKHPNIIYIYADDLGYGELGSYGQQKIETPNLDRMAKEGMRFTQHYSSMPVCAPARASLLTGKHSGHAYIRGNYELGGFADSAERGQLPLKDGSFTIAHLLKQKGYKTGLIGKWGLGMGDTEGSPLNQGFDYYYGYLDQKQAHNFYPTHLWENSKWDTLDQAFINVHQRFDPAKATDSDFDAFKGNDYAPAKMTEKAIAFLEDNKNGPFFLYLPYTLPHVSLQVPDSYVQKYIGRFDERPYYGQQGYAPHKHPLSAYAAMITYLDDQVGIIMEKIKALGLDENTLIMFSSDNGPTFNGGVDAKFFNSTAGLRGLKLDLYEGGIRVPFIARWPSHITANTTSNLISVQYDLMATLAELTEQKVRNTDGISFLPELMSNPDQKEHGFLYFEYHHGGGQLAIRMGKWKGIKTQLINDPDSPWQLYNLESDRAETTDVAGQHPQVIKKLNRIVKREHEPSHIEEWNFMK